MPRRHNQFPDAARVASALAEGGRLGAKRAQVAVAHQPVVRLVPQAELEGLQAGSQRDGRDALEERLGVVAFLEVVIGDQRAQVVQVVEADVAREPLQDAGQLVERAALQGRGGPLTP